MSLRPQPGEPRPEQTVRVAPAAFPKGHPYLTLRAHLGIIVQDDAFAAWLPTGGSPGLPSWRVALVTVRQFREHLADRQAAEALRARMDWPYVLGLDLTEAGCAFSVLRAFRERLLTGRAAALWLDKRRGRCRALGLRTARGQQRPDSTHGLVAMRVLNRLALVAETLRAALNALATGAPTWLQERAPWAWDERYGRRIEDTRLPQSQASRDAYAQTVGEEGLA
jgi:transposase